MPSLKVYSLKSLLSNCCVSSRQVFVSRSFSSININPHPITFERLLSDENKRRAQERLVTVEPVRTAKDYDLKSGHSTAAVLVPLCTVHNEPSLILTLRSTKLKKHRGQVSFPGGNTDKNDKDFIATALRETQEELGLDPATFDIWGQMKSLPGSGGNKVVYPILACTGEVDPSQMPINHDEVEEAFCVSIRHLCDHQHIGQTFFREGSGYTLPVYTGATHRIWGLTAVIVHQALSIIAPGLYTYKVRHRKPLYQLK
ncbi:mitochondrial coenzyme A diphosphatase NUDT8-like [Physella acuta]|uniref:mitochondrial coenzyme A diphosphatase NUDT8-like n=1 Tax=Physella acuta TaxID=109671 RepID=UPI0027DE2956|nr:mitochondrial coenzyme A diphosphatase NUDT8-like [Physella acuta]XP_059139525.1 mitochondrial coenzyme A diphosphatase NUDT8-like [Physella acuta]